MMSSLPNRKTLQDSGCNCRSSTYPERNTPWREQNWGRLEWEVLVFPLVSRNRVRRGVVIDALDYVNSNGIDI